MRAKVLIVDDEERMRAMLALHLRQVFEVKTVASGEEALDALNREPMDLVILDVLMPGMDGWEVCRRIRERSSAPVLMLTALSDIDDKLEAFGAGADDYLTKPFDPRELVARAEALVRRRVGEQTQVTKPAPRRLIFPRLEIDLDGRQVMVDGKEAALTPKEFDLLVRLASEPGRAFSREHLLQEVWGDAAYAETRTIDSHIKTLREKLGREGVGRRLVTVWGVGYKYDDRHERGGA